MAMFELMQGDCLEVLKTLEAESFDCMVTSPPYYGLRDYGCEGQIGLEPTLDAYVEKLCAVFDEIWRVLKPTGTAWLNLGDSYANAGVSGPQGKSGDRATRTFTAAGNMPKVGNGLKSKDLCGVPWTVAFALRARGWYLRSAVVWHKPNPMPESVRDRPTSAYEMVFLLTKGERYFYDADAIAEEAAVPIDKFVSAKGSNCMDGSALRNDKSRHGGGQLGRAGIRNARNVWTIAPRPFKGSHFATMPPDLAERCIKAGCPVGGRVLDPFGGAGTTALVAERLGRHATLIELNPVYREMAEKRIGQVENGLFDGLHGASDAVITHDTLGEVA